MATISLLQKSLDNDKENTQFILKNFWRLLNYKTSNVKLPQELELRSSTHSQIPAGAPRRSEELADM